MLPPFRSSATAHLLLRKKERETLAHIRPVFRPRQSLVAAIEGQVAAVNPHLATARRVGRSAESIPDAITSTKEPPTITINRAMATE